LLLDTVVLPDTVAVPAMVVLPDRVVLPLMLLRQRVPLPMQRKSNS
jgi:hypothetical protein